MNAKRAVPILSAIALGMAANLVHANPTLTTLATFQGTSGFVSQGSLILSGNTLYGEEDATTTSGYGTVFSVPVSGGSHTTLATFGNGAGPSGGLILSGGTLYGMTSGFNDGDGTVFSLPVGGGTPTTLATFNGSNGSDPDGTLLLSGGKLYGVAYNGGKASDGTVFSVPVGGGTITTLAYFNGSNTGLSGSHPLAGLILSGSTLYGTTEYGGTSNAGIVFSLPLSGGTPTTLANFSLSNTAGALPFASLILSGGTLYGTARQGGIDGPYSETYGCGTVFSLPVGGGNPTALATFDGSDDGEYPEGSLFLSGNTLYGTSSGDSPLCDATVFSIPITGGTLNTLVTFNGTTNGDDPTGGLISDAYGDLFGTTNSTSEVDGTVFEIASVPEPSSVSLLAIGGIGLLTRRRLTSLP